MTEQTFLDRLAEIRASNCENLPTPEYATLSRTIARLREMNFHERSLQVGETVPDFEFIDSNHSTDNLYRVLDRGPVILNFFRGYWCPYCKTEIEAYENIQGEVARLGASYFAISPQRRELTPAHPESYEVIYDRDNRIAREFGLVYGLLQEEIDLFASWGLDLEAVNGTTVWELPVPATFIVCADRRIGYKYIDVDFRSRCCPEQLLDELRAFTA